MTEKIGNWAEGIIIAIIIGTILQIILPDNKNKKYIKVVVGIYVLFCIIHPVIGTSFNINDYDISKYVEIGETNNINGASFDSNVKTAFQDKMKQSIKQHLNNKGYDSNNIEIVADGEYSVTSVKIKDVKEYTKNNNEVNRIEISIKDKPVTGMGIGDKYELKKYIAETYEMNESNVIIE